MMESHLPLCLLRLVVITTLVLAAVPSAFASDAAMLAADPHEVVGYKQCSKCHEAEIDVWKKTPHHRTFDTLHRNPEAKAIASRLGLKSIKRNDTCIQCHYTQQIHRNRVKPISGVSCESCHGGAKHWLEIHNDYGGEHVTREQESAEHKRRRREASIAKGMRNPFNLYLVAQSCLACHTTPNEELVNVGGHPAGSADFELVAWSQGMVRHKFIASDGKHNAESSLDRKRLMYVVGRMADLEYSLRATAKATNKAKYGVTSAKRADRVRRELRQIQERVRHPLLQEIIDAAYQAKLKPNNAAALTAAADVISQAAYRFAATVDGGQLQVVDALLPQPDSYK